MKQKGPATVLRLCFGGERRHRRRHPELSTEAENRACPEDPGPHRWEDLDDPGPLGLKLFGLGKQGGQAPGVPEAARLAGSDAAAPDEVQEAGQGLAGVDIFD